VKIPFNKVSLVGNEKRYIQEAIESGYLCGGGHFEDKCHSWFSNNLGISNVLMVPSCTHALEMMALLLEIKEGDEVIMPSYTFVSTANAFVLRGAKIVFVDIREDNFNIDETLIESAITSKTKAILAVHYAGVACEMDTIMDIASRYSLYVLEDAAQAIMSKYKGKYLGTIGHLGAYSFHETKNITSGGEGGLLLINDEQFLDRAHIIREKGTNRKQFINGQVDKYSWIDLGSSFMSTELQSGFLLGQLEQSHQIIKKRLMLWEEYYRYLRNLEESGYLRLPIISDSCEHNAHIFYILLKNKRQRSSLISYLKDKDIDSVFHYIPLHTSPFGKTLARFHGEDIFTSLHSENLLRLPLFYSLDFNEVHIICNHINDFFLNRKLNY
jgi:dTDP-4-amino-4,6-dideoxygalactose transaminase